MFGNLPAAFAVVAVLLRCTSAVTPMEDPCTTTATKTDPAPDHSVFSSLLHSAVLVNGTQDGITANLVNYRMIRKDPSKLKQYMLSLCNVNVDALTTEAQLAFWANAYNALMISIMVHYNSAGESVKQLHKVAPGGSIWKEPLGTVAGEKVSLDIIEHVKVRGSGLAHSAGIAGRIHSAFVCASLSCPDLQPEAFEANTIVAQVTANAKSWLANPTKNPGPDASNFVTISEIFKWYGGDFEMESQTIPGFLRAYSPWEDAQIPDDAGIGYIKYNWNLNGMNITASSAATATAACSWPTHLLVASVIVLAILLQ